MTTLRITVLGISCLADPRKDGAGQPIDPFKKRVLLPTDTISDETHPPHIPFVEVAELDLYNNPGTISGLSERYVRGDIAYRRFELYGHYLWLDDVDTTQGWTVSPLFDYRVAQMTKVQPELHEHPRQECFHAAPPVGLISGYFDMYYGRLSIGNIDTQYTAFSPLKDWPRRRLAVSSVLEVELTALTPFFRIVVAGQAPGTGTPVRLKADATGIAIGNLPQSELEEMGQSTEHLAHDFLMFYNLADTQPTEYPVPNRPAGLDVGCSNSAWP